MQGPELYPKPPNSIFNSSPASKTNGKQYSEAVQKLASDILKHPSKPLNWNPTHNAICEHIQSAKNEIDKEANRIAAVASAEMFFLLHQEYLPNTYQMTPQIRVLDEMGAMEQSALRDNYIVNCADQCPNYYEGPGVEYHKIDGWIDKADEKKDNPSDLGALKHNMLKALDFAMDKINKGDNVVFHCIEGKSRSLSMAILAETLREFTENPTKFGVTPLPKLIQTLRINRLAFYLKRGFGLAQGTLEKHIALEAKAMSETFENAAETFDIDEFIRELNQKFKTWDCCEIT